MIEVPIAERSAVTIKFGGWYEGDNHKPGRAWYFVCRCGQIGMGQLLQFDAVRSWKKHARRCEHVSKEEAA